MKPSEPAKATSSVEVNKKAPDFSVDATGDQTFKLSDCRGQNLVLYFYPRDNTPGCKREGQAFRDHYAEFTRNNTTVVGVSRDSIKSHQRFKEKQGFPFELLSDPNETLCNLYGVINDKNLYGRLFRGIERSTFLIDAQGKLRRQWRRVRVNGHVEEVLEAVRELNRCQGNPDTPPHRPSTQNSKRTPPRK